MGIYVNSFVFPYVMGRRMAAFLANSLSAKEMFC